MTRRTSTAFWAMQQTPDPLRSPTVELLSVIHTPSHQPPTLPPSPAHPAHPAPSPPPGPKEGVLDLAWHPQRSLLLSCSSSGRIFIWAKVRSGRPAPSCPASCPATTPPCAPLRHVVPGHTGPGRGGHARIYFPRGRPLSARPAACRDPVPPRVQPPSTATPRLLRPKPHRHAPCIRLAVCLKPHGTDATAPFCCVGPLRLAVAHHLPCRCTLRTGPPSRPTSRNWTRTPSTWSGRTSSTGTRR